MGKSICSIEGCERLRESRGWCHTHYTRWYRHGSPDTAKNMFGTDIDRFLAKVHKTETCWLWTRGTNRAGYGRLSIKGKPTFAYRLAYELFIGPIPEGLQLDHLCHSSDLDCVGGPSCPHRRCVNPHHLEPVTSQENTRRGRRWPDARSCHGY